MRLLKTAFCSLLLAIHALASGLTLQAAELWVSPGGNDANPGTPAQPLASLSQAFLRESALLQSNTIPPGEPVKFILDGGIYSLAAPLAFIPNDSVNPISIEAAPSQNPVLSGGITISGWKKTTVRGLSQPAKGNVWVADAPIVNGNVLEFRQLWVNGQKAVWARNPNGESMSRLLGWDKTNQTAIIPAALLAGVRQSRSVPGGD